MALEEYLRANSSKLSSDSKVAPFFYTVDPLSPVKQDPATGTVPTEKKPRARRQTIKAREELKEAPEEWVAHAHRTSSASHRTQPSASHPPKNKPTSHRSANHSPNQPQRHLQPQQRPPQNPRPHPLPRAHHALTPLPRPPRKPNRRPHHHPPHNPHNLRRPLPPPTDPRPHPRLPQHSHRHRTPHPRNRSLGPPLPNPPPPPPHDVTRDPGARHVGAPAPRPGFLCAAHWRVLGALWAVAVHERAVAVGGGVVCQSEGGGRLRCCEFQYRQGDCGMGCLCEGWGFGREREGCGEGGSGWECRDACWRGRRGVGGGLWGCVEEIEAARGGRRGMGWEVEMGWGEGDVREYKQYGSKGVAGRALDMLVVCFRPCS